MRVGELETPSDVDIIAVHLHQHREARLAPASEASQYADNMTAALADTDAAADCCGQPAPWRLLATVAVAAWQTVGYTMTRTSWRCT